MTNHNDIGKRIQQYLDEIEAHLNQPHSQKSEVLQNVEVHIRDALARKSENNPNIDDLEAVIAEMDSPESYGEHPPTKQPRSAMKPLIYGAVVFTASLGIWLVSTVKKGCTTGDSPPLIGQSKLDALHDLGKPTLVQGPEAGYQTYHYAERGLDVVFNNGKIVQYTIRGNCTLKTDAGVGIGADISEVTRAYGQYKRTEEVAVWFGGNVSRVLYHHEEFDKYKINYPDRDLIFIFDRNKKVELIMVGYIFPVEEDTKP